MSVAPRIPLRAIGDVLDALFGRDVHVHGATEMDLYVPSICGLSTAADELVGAIGADRDFVDSTGAVLGEMSADGGGSIGGTEPIDRFSEVTGVLAGLVNEFGDQPLTTRSNIDPSTTDLGLIIGAAERCLFTLEIEGVGTGVAGIWTCL